MNRKILVILLLASLLIPLQHESKAIEENSVDVFVECNLILVEGVVSNAFGIPFVFTHFQIRGENTTAYVLLCEEKVSIPIKGDVDIMLFSYSGNRVKGWEFSLCLVEYI